MSVHRETFTAFVKRSFPIGGSDSIRGAELGVDKGILFGMLLRECPTLRLLGVDTFPDAQRSHRVPKIAAEYADRSELKAMTTAAASETVPNRLLDFVFIDADHSYEAVLQDIALWLPKVRAGGWIGGHDYHARKFPGVVKAVNEAFTGRHHEMPGTIWGFWVSPEREHQQPGDFRTPAQSVGLRC